MRGAKETREVGKEWRISDLRGRGSKDDGAASLLCGKLAASVLHYSDVTWKCRNKSRVFF